MLSRLSLLRARATGLRLQTPHRFAVRRVRASWRIVVTMSIVGFERPRSILEMYFGARLHRH
jgi:hypothetical protein